MAPVIDQAAKTLYEKKIQANAFRYVGISLKELIPIYEKLTEEIIREAIRRSETNGVFFTSIPNEEYHQGPGSDIL